MIILFIIFVVPFIVAVVAAYFIALLVYNELVKTGKKHPRLFRGLTFIVSFLLVLVAVFWLISSNVHFTR